MELYCKKCNEKLTKEPLTKAEVSSLNYEDEHDLVPLYQYVKTKDSDFDFKNSIDFLVNNKSLNLNNHSASDRFQGCCGPSVFETLNQVCPKCNAEIGVLINDCWTPCFVGIDSNKICCESQW